MISAKDKSLLLIIVFIVCTAHVTNAKNIRFEKPNSFEVPAHSPNNLFTVEEKNARRKLGDDLMNILFSGEFVDDVPMNRRTNGVASFLKNNENVIGSISNFTRSHSSPDGYTHKNTQNKAENEQEQKKLLVKEAISVYKDYDKDDINRQGMIQLHFLVSDWIEVVDDANVPGNVNEPAGYFLYDGKLVDETGTNAGSINGRCYIMPQMVENLCIFNLVVINDAGIEAGTLNVHGTSLGDKDKIHASVFAVVGGTGVFAGASGSAIWDQGPFPDGSGTYNKWIITIYECWDHPVVEAETA